MKKVVPYFILTIFGFYWMCTLLYVSPKNYIKIELLEQEQLFTTFFFQKWGFFAPPPKYNDRLYFRFESKKDPTKSISFEVIEDLQKRKTRKAPFSSSEDILDYVISGTLHGISDGLYAVEQSMQYEEEVIDSLKNSGYSETEKIEKRKAYVQETSNFKTLKNYALFLAEKNNLKNISDYNLQVEIAQIDLPKFADRHQINQDSVATEKLIFRSDKIVL